MLSCPSCETTLSRRKSRLGFFWVCRSCRGRAVTVEVLRKIVPRPLLNSLWQMARSGRHDGDRKCPSCLRSMKAVPLGVSDSIEEIDVCNGCHFVWFDAGEFEALPKTSLRKPPDVKLSADQAETLALQRLEEVRQKQFMDETSPDHWWEVAVAFCGIPVEYNRTALKNRPIATWVLAILIAAVSIATFRNLVPAIDGWGLIPAQFGRHFGLTFITSFFLHGGLLHLLGNLYYLVVFGDNSEDVLGKGRYLLLIATAAIVGDVAHILSNPGSTTPCVGASGGISGVLAYYCLRFPHARVGIIFWLRWVRLPVGAMFALWVVLQVMTAIQQSAGIGRVAVFAHLGGAAVGVLFWLATRQTFSEAEGSDPSAPGRGIS